MTTDIVYRLKVDDTEVKRSASQLSNMLEQEFRKIENAINKALSSQSDQVDLNPYRELSEEIEKARKQLVEYNRVQDDVASSTEKNAKQSEESVNSLNDSYAGLSKTLGNINQLATTLGIGFGLSEVIGQVRQSFAIFDQFQTRFSEVLTLIPDVAGTEIADFRREIIDLGVEIGRTSDELLPALYQALSAGVDRVNVLDFLEEANNAAIAGVTDLQTAVTTLTSIVNAYGSDVISTAEASDILFTSIKLGITTFEEIGASIAFVTPIAASLGIDFRDIAAALSTLTSIGTPTAQAITQIRSALVALADVESDVSVFFRELTGVTFQEFIEQGGNLQEAFAIIAQGAEESGLELIQLFGRVEASTAAITLGAEQVDKYASNLKAMEDSIGATDIAASKFDGNLDRLNARYDAQRERLQLLFAEGLLPFRLRVLEISSSILEDLVPALDVLIGRYNDLISRQVEANESLSFEERFANLSGAFPTDFGGAATATLFGLDDPLVEGLRELAVDVVRGADDVDEALDRLEEVFGRSEGFLQEGLSLSRFDSDQLNLVVGEGISSFSFTIGSLQELLNQANEDAGELNDKLLQTANQLDDTSDSAETAAKSIGTLTDAQISSALAASDNQEAQERLAKTQRELAASSILALDGIDEATEALIKQALEAEADAETIINLAESFGALTPSQSDALSEMIKISTELQTLRASTIDAGTATDEQIDEIKALEESLSSLQAELFGAANAQDQFADATNRTAKTLAESLDERFSQSRRSGTRRGISSANQRLLDEAENRLEQAENDLDEAESNLEQAEDILLETESNLRDAEDALRIAENAFSDADEALDDAQDELRGAIQRDVDDFAEIIRIQLEQAEEIADAQNALKEAIAEGDTDAVSRLTDELLEAQGATTDWREDLFDLSLQAGASIDKLIALGVATGQFTEEQARAALAQLAQTRGLEQIADAFVRGAITAEQATQAAKALNEQLAAGENIDLSEFGISFDEVDTSAQTGEGDEFTSVEDARETVREASDTRDQAQESLNDAEAARNEAENARSDAEVALAEAESARDAAKASADGAKETLSAVRDEVRKTNSAVASSNQTATESFTKLTIAKLLDKAATEENSIAANSYIESALNLAVQAGLLTQAQADNELQTAKLKTETDLLTESQDFLTASTQEQLGAIALLEGGYVTNGEAAITLSKKIGDDLIPQFLNVLTETGNIKTALDNVGISIDELPDEVKIELETNADDVSSDLDDIDRKLDELNQKRVEILIETKLEEGNIPLPDDARASGGSVKGGETYIVNDAGREEYFISRDGTRQFTIPSVEPQVFVAPEDGFVLRRIPRTGEDLIDLLSGLGDSARRSVDNLSSISDLPAVSQLNAGTISDRLAEDISIGESGNNTVGVSPSSSIASNIVSSLGIPDISNTPRPSISPAPNNNTISNSITNSQTIDNSTKTFILTVRDNDDIVAIQQEQI